MKQRIVGGMRIPTDNRDQVVCSECKQKRVRAMEGVYNFFENGWLVARGVLDFHLGSTSLTPWSSRAC
jgi:hypothetical protein